MVEDVNFLKDSPDAVQRRFDIYKGLGFGTLRTSIAWRHQALTEGDWSGAATLQPYLARAIANGFRLKMSVETLGAPPGWFLRAHPDAGMRNAADEVSQNDLSLWYPGLRPLLADTADRLFGRLSEMGVFGAIDWIFADLGPASEPIYPAAWTQGKASCQEATPWFYGDHARAAFARTMTRKYRAIEAANGAWGTNFRDWPEVRLPLPGVQAGGLWKDVLVWYRDSKRAFIRWQIANYQRALAAFAPAAARPGLLIMVPGRHIQPQEWRHAVAAGMPDCSLAIMTDTEFLLDLAKELGCGLQYTADENADEVAYLCAYMRGHANTQTLWGENVGTMPVAGRPNHIADVILANGLYGMDYVRSSRLFEADGVTPNGVVGELAVACRRLRQAWQ
jgi:beta-galactosidase GanA